MASGRLGELAAVAHGARGRAAEGRADGGAILPTPLRTRAAEGAPGGSRGRNCAGVGAPAGVPGRSGRGRMRLALAGGSGGSGATPRAVRVPQRSAERAPEGRPPMSVVSGC